MPVEAVLKSDTINVSRKRFKSLLRQKISGKKTMFIFLTEQELYHAL